MIKRLIKWLTFKRIPNIEDAPAYKPQIMAVNSTDWDALVNGYDNEMVFNPEGPRIRFVVSEYDDDFTGPTGNEVTVEIAHATLEIVQS